MRAVLPGPAVASQMPAIFHGLCQGRAVAAAVAPEQRRAPAHRQPADSERRERPGPAMGRVVVVQDPCLQPAEQEASPARLAYRQAGMEGLEAAAVAPMLRAAWG